MNTEEVNSGSSPELEPETTEEVVDSSETQPGETEESLLSVVQAVAAESSAQALSDSEVVDSDEASDTETIDGASDSPSGEDYETGAVDGESQEDYTDVPFNKHPRFKELIREKNSYKARASEYESDANQYRQIQQFMNARQLSAEEVAEGLMLMAEMKSGDPAKAYDQLSKKLDQLAPFAGKKLPQELEERVEQGYVDRETAQQLYYQQMRASQQAALAQQQLSKQRQLEQQQKMTSMVDSVSAWETATREKDPDFDLKADLVKDRVRAHFAQHGMPKSSEEALAISMQAYDRVTEALRKVQTPKQPVRSAVGGRTNGAASPEPQNLLDVVRRAAAGG